MTTYSVGDQTDFHRILEAQRPRLVRLCAYLIGDRDAAEDAAQEVLIEAWQHCDGLRDPQALQAWLWGIARNVSARWLRAHGRERALLGRLDEAQIGQQPLVDAVDLEVELDRHELAVLLDRALALLPEATRAVLMQKYVAELPHAAIAAQLGLSENLVAVRIHRGKLALRKLLTTELRGELEPLGITGDAWQETRIWCSLCGQHRLRGKLTDAEFVLRCPACCVEPGSFYVQSNVMPIFSGAKSFRPILNRFYAWMDTFFQSATTHGSFPCQRCGRSTPLHLRLPDGAPPWLRSQRGLHVKCSFCGSGSYGLLSSFALTLPEGQRFWRANQRIRTLPEREVDIDGAPALVLPFEQVDRQDALQVVVRRDTYEVLQIRRGRDV